MNEKKRIVIVGGGVGGIITALALERQHIPDAHIVLISDKPHFEYRSALYRLVTGSSSLEVCIPLNEIFVGKNVEVIEDFISEIHQDEKILVGTSGVRYSYEYVVLALGSETNYFHIDGLKEFSYGMKSIEEALLLKKHITETLLSCKTNANDKAEQVNDANFVVIGAGATGVELAGQLIVYARTLASEYGIDPSIVSVGVIEGASKVLPALPSAFTDRIEQRLRSLGVNIFLNRSIEREEVEEVFLKDMKMRARTVIWTAGVRAHENYEKWKLPVDKRGKVEVDEHLRLKNDQSVYVIGDGAVTKYSGWAQTALYDGKYAAEIIARVHRGNNVLPPYAPKAPINAIPVGPKWAGVDIGAFPIYGKLGWWIRRMADLRLFMSILPLGKALKAWRNGQSICNTCSICSVRGKHAH